MRQFLSVQEAAEELGVSDAYVRQLISGIQRHTPERYYLADVFQGGKRAVRFAALMDYAAYRDRLEGRSDIPAPPYDPLTREAELGIISGPLPKVEIEQIGKAVCTELMRMFGGIVYGN